MRATDREEYIPVQEAQHSIDGAGIDRAVRREWSCGYGGPGAKGQIAPQVR